MNTYRVYKANKQGNGSASEWQLAYKRDDQYSPWKLFFSLAAQAGIDSNGNARFNWENPIRVKMDLSDIGEILTVLSGLQLQAGPGGKLFHKNDRGNKIIQFNRNRDTNNYFIKVSQQTQQGTTALQQNLTTAEGYTLKVLLEHAILKLANWGLRGRRQAPNTYSNQQPGMQPPIQPPPQSPPPYSNQAPVAQMG